MITWMRCLILEFVSLATKPGTAAVYERSAAAVYTACVPARSRQVAAPRVCLPIVATEAHMELALLPPDSGASFGFRREFWPGRLAPNSAQSGAITGVLQQSIGLIHGPSGTGKTKVIIALARTLVAANLSRIKNKPIAILVCTDANTALDNIMAPLLEMGLKCLRVGRKGQQSPIRAIRENTLGPKGERMKQFRNAEVRQRLRACQGCDSALG